MANLILMPELSPDAKKYTIVEWHKQENSPVHAGDVIFTAVVGKANVEVECEHDGTLLKIIVTGGKKAKAGQPIAVVGEAGEELPDLSAYEQSDLKDEDAISVAIIGGGPGGYVAAIAAAQRGARVTLIEKNKLGGTCLNAGCIPTKSLLHSAEILAQLKTAGIYGVISGEPAFDWNAVLARKDAVTKQLRDGITGLMLQNDIEVLHGEASFSAQKELTVLQGDGQRLTLAPDRIIIASGGAPVMPPIPGLRDNPHCIDSTAALSLPEFPKRMAVIGGGVIGIELAFAYAGFGAEVTVLELLPKLLPMMDEELTAHVRQNMEKAGIRFHLETKVAAVHPQENGVQVEAVLPDGSTVMIEADKALFAVGRCPMTEGLNLAAAGIETEHGRILVNKRMCTNVPDVYAIGDCAGRITLAHTASAMGETAAINATGGRSIYRDDVCPACVYVQPEFAGVGLTEQQAIEKGISYKVGRFPMAANGKALISGDTDGLVKVIAEKSSDEILGVHILGPRATDIIAEAALAIRMGATTGQFADTIHAHPTVSECLREAALAVDGRAIHFK